jgi:hypothetical protein
MAIQFVGANASAGATTQTQTPPHQAGDLVLLWAFNINGAAITPPAGEGTVVFNWTTASGSSCLVYRTATANQAAFELTGSFTGAIGVLCSVYRGSNPLTVASHGRVSTNFGTQRTPQITPFNQGAWIVGFSGRSANVASMGNIPTALSFTQRAIANSHVNARANVYDNGGSTAVGTTRMELDVNVGDATSRNQCTTFVEIVELAAVGDPNKIVSVSPFVGTTIQPIGSTNNFTNEHVHDWLVPNNVTSLYVECFGAGASLIAQSSTQAGAPGGGYAAGTIAATPGTVHRIGHSAPGNSGSTTTTWFGLTTDTNNTAPVRATSGVGNTPGTGVAGTVLFTGGTGAAAQGGGGSRGGSGGGGGAGPGGNGSNGTAGSGSTPGVGGAGGGPNGGAGGTGGAPAGSGATVIDFTGGGGGGGGGSSAWVGGRGGTPGGGQGGSGSSSSSTETVLAGFSAVVINFTVEAPAGPVTHEGTITSATSSGHSLQGRYTAAGTVTSATTSGHTLAGTRIQPGAVTSATTSGHSLAGELFIPPAVLNGTVTSASNSGHTLSGTRLANGAVTSASTSGHSLGSNMTWGGSVTSTSTSGHTLAGTRIQPGAVTSTSVSGHTLGSNMVWGGSVTSASTSGHSLSGAYRLFATIVSAAVSGHSLDAQIVGGINWIDGAVTSPATSGHSLQGTNRVAGTATSASTSASSIVGVIIRQGTITRAATSATTLNGQVFRAGNITTGATSTSEFGGNVVFSASVQASGASGHLPLEAGMGITGDVLASAVSGALLNGTAQLWEEILTGPQVWTPVADTDVVWS